MICDDKSTKKFLFIKKIRIFVHYFLIRIIMLKRLLFYTVFFILCSQPAFSVPAYPYFTTVTQPDGKIITLKMKGDEHIKWMESEDGYSLLYDKDRYIVYATLNEKGDMIPSSLKASDIAARTPEINAQLKTIAKGLQYSNEQKQILRQIRQMKEETIIKARSSQAALRSATGHAKAICALIQFNDKHFSHTVSEFEALMNQEGYNLKGARGSVRDFYLENSYGLLTLEVTIAGIYTAAKNWAYYGENDADGRDKHPEELAKEAANFTFNDPSIVPDDYDNDNDGYIDTFHFIYAGYGEEISGNSPDCIWAHKYGFYPTALTFIGKKLDTYSCSPELRGNSGSDITHIGTICHELCHVFGAPDFYDADGKDNSGYEFSGTGKWDLMAGGSWNSNGASPAHINMYQKIAFGWVNPNELNSKQTITNMPNSAQNPVAYIINTPQSGEYFVLENRQKEGFDSAIPGHGLLIYHVSITQNDIDYNIVNNKHPQKVYPVYAASNLAIPTGTPDSYGSINSASCPFPGPDIVPKSTFNQTSAPALQTWETIPINKAITNITEANGFISFQFISYLLNLTASVSGKKVTLNWDIPSGVGEIKGYNVYRNNELVLKTTENLCRNTVKEDGTYIYSVSIQFENSESEKEEVTVSVNSTALTVFEKNPIHIYPNPIEKGSLLIVENSEYSQLDLLLYKPSGQLIMRKQTSSPYSQHIIDLPSGMYLLKIIKEHETETFKLIVN
jgi:M6 family metalloprotease-like protein